MTVPKNSVISTSALTSPVKVKSSTSFSRERDLDLSAERFL